MRVLEEKFGKPHPELADYKPLAPQLEWLQAAFLRLHRRRQVTEIGLQPLPFETLTVFAEKIMNLKGDAMDSFIRIIEHIDNGVLHDFYVARNAQHTNK